MQQLEDRALVRLCREGRSEAFAEIYRRYLDLVVRYLLSRTRQNHEVARELASEIFTQVLANLDSYRGEAPFRSWLFSIARNELFDWYARQVSRTSHRMSLQSEVRSVEDKVLQKHRMDQIFRQVRRWPEVKQNIFYLVAVAGVSQHEVSKKVGLSHVAVRQIFSRLRRELRSLLDEEGAPGKNP